ncbi:MAG TPA: glycerol-3-phosphate acyltransferase [Bacteroidota bacterium]|nr:glycerol-3-phosphate acyltransferase [Bacteroidota bacterium]
MFSFVLAGFLGYLLGSIPTAYLLVHWKSRLDIRSAGSGNVGTLNSYEVTGSYLVGAAVLAVDAAKGIAAVAASGVLPGHDFALQACAGFFAILGHNFSVWIRFRGGRGLAAAAGVFSMFCWPLVPVWGALWAGAYLILKEVNPANAVASIIIPVLIALAPGPLLSRFAPGGVGRGEFALFAAVSMIVVLMKHLEPVRAYIGKRRKSADRPHDTGGTENR